MRVSARSRLPSHRPWELALGLAGGAVMYRLLQRARTAAPAGEPVTGLPGRAEFARGVRQALERSRRSGTRVAVCVIDLDRFKPVNDSLGHAAGDRLLSSIAERLRETVRHTDLVARLGGDEFALALEGLESDAEATVAGERLARRLAHPLALGDSEFMIPVSVGVAVAPAGSRNVDALIEDADTAMLEAKARGGNQVVLFDEALRATRRAHSAIETGLRSAIARGELRVHYQPIVSMDGERVPYVEALVRWQHPERGLLAPGEFIPIAERSGQIRAIGLWVLEEACRQMMAWRAEDPDAPLPVLCVNMAAQQLADPRLPGALECILANTGLEPHLLALELTESTLLDDVAGTRAALSALKQLGVNLILDDFGTGYSSLSYLDRLPIDAVKVDRSFVARLGARHGSDAILAAVIAMTNALGIAAVAEGVERTDQAERLRALGYGIAQGFLYARPAPAEAVDVRGRAVPKIRRELQRNIVTCDTLPFT